jgi:hypothetical protein
VESGLSTSDCNLLGRPSCWILNNRRSSLSICRFSFFDPLFLSHSSIKGHESSRDLWALSSRFILKSIDWRFAFLFIVSSCFLAFQSKLMNGLLMICFWVGHSFVVLSDDTSRVVVRPQNNGDIFESRPRERLEGVVTPAMKCARQVFRHSLRKAEHAGSESPNKEITGVDSHKQDFLN